jgi:RNA polymerase sigma-70 factor (ECF subfamily)
VLGLGEFARLFQEQWRVLWCAAVAVVGDRALAQDVVQQAAVVALERLDRFEVGTSFTAWMVQIVRNIALNEARKRGRRRTGPADHATLDAAAARAGSARTEGVLTGRGQVAPGAEPFDDDLRRALAGLDETARGCLLMRVVLDMPYRQIALALGVPEGTAASHVHRARAALRAALRGPGGTDGGPGTGGTRLAGGHP